MNLSYANLTRSIEVKTDYNDYTFKEYYTDNGNHKHLQVVTGPRIVLQTMHDVAWFGEIGLGLDVSKENHDLELDYMVSESNTDRFIISPACGLRILNNSYPVQIELFAKGILDSQFDSEKYSLGYYGVCVRYSFGQI